MKININYSVEQFPFSFELNNGIKSIGFKGKPLVKKSITKSSKFVFKCDINITLRTVLLLLTFLNSPDLVENLIQSDVIKSIIAANK